jgi:hypothetical protein
MGEAMNTKDIKLLPAGLPRLTNPLDDIQAAQAPIGTSTSSFKSRYKMAKPAPGLRFL